MSDFLSMGGYAFYVWTSYGLVAAVLAINFLKPWLEGRRLRRVLTRRLAAARRTP